MGEYILLENETKKTFQCKLNQWRHKYKIKIHWVDKQITLSWIKEEQSVVYFALIERIPNGNTTGDS